MPTFELPTYKSGVKLSLNNSHRKNIVKETLEHFNISKDQEEHEEKERKVNELESTKLTLNNILMVNKGEISVDLIMSILIATTLSDNDKDTLIKIYSNSKSTKRIYKQCLSEQHNMSSNSVNAFRNQK